VATDNTRGALFMALSMAGFACNDAIMKYTFETMPLAQGVFLRGLFATALVGALAWRARALFYVPRRGERLPLLFRTIGELGATASFMIAIANMPIAAATAVLQAAPLGVTLAAALFLAEPVGWRRWTAILVGFGGVLIMIRPGTDDFNLFAAVAFITVCFIVVRDLTTRAMGPRVPTLFASFLTASSVTLTAGLLSPIEGWRPVSGEIMALYAAAAGFIIVGYVFITVAMRLGDVSAVSPFRYAVLLWALVLGLIVFKEVPSLPTLAGAAIVVAAGLYTLWREQTVARRRTAATASTRPFAPGPAAARRRDTDN
jgi:drug/metabolite transporter (DMT)-like permease